MHYYERRPDHRRKSKAPDVRGEVLEKKGTWASIGKQKSDFGCAKPGTFLHGEEKLNRGASNKRDFRINSPFRGGKFYPDEQEEDLGSEGRG